MKKMILITCIFALLLFWGLAPSSVVSQPAAAASTVTTARTEPLIIDHTTADINAIPQQWIEAAKQNLHIGYGHTSHGSQVTTGMGGLVAFANNNGRGLSLPDDIFKFNHDSNLGGTELHLFEGDGYGDGDLDHDAGYYPNWVNETQSYLGPVNAFGRGSNHPEINVIMWSWCGQVSGKTEQAMIDEYLQPMNQFEATYPGITFVYMTGHADGTGETGNLHIRNQQIRQYAIDNNKVLFDFYDFDTHDPDGNYYGDKNVDDYCNYDGGNWCQEWQSSHTEGVDWYTVSCAHSQSINCNQKAYGIWWLWASLAGWNAAAAEPDLSPSTKVANRVAVDFGDTITYTVQIENANDPLTNTVQMSDTIPSDLAYVPGSLTATLGSVDDSGAPDLSWTGVLTPTPSVTITYVVTVTAVDPQAITNTATFTIPGYDPMSRSATIIANGFEVYLPLIQR